MTSKSVSFRPTLLNPAKLNPAPLAPQRYPPYSPAVPAVASAAPSALRAGTIPTRLLLVSDTHTHHPYPPSNASSAFKSPLPHADVLIHAGDLTTMGQLREMRETFAWVAAAPAPIKLVIAGNHDTGLDDPAAYLAWARTMGPVSRSGRSKMSAETERALLREADEVRQLWTGDEARAAGIRYLDEGTHSFDLENGATLKVYASPYTPEYCTWAFMYPREADRYNGGADPPAPHPVPDFPAVDVVVTHGPAEKLLDRAGPPATHVGCAHLLRALARARPRLHVFGHIHEDWGMMRVDWKEGSGEYVRPRTEELESDREFARAARRGWMGWRETDGCGTVRTDGDQGREEDADAFVAGEPLRWGQDTLCVNASVMTNRFRARNAPWVVDLLLPAREPADA